MFSQLLQFLLLIQQRLLLRSKIPPSPAPSLDKALYDQKIEFLANNPAPVVATSVATTIKTLPPHIKNLWPVKTVYPNYGALLPFNRIVAYYGNFYSTKMGVLGEYPPRTDAFDAYE